MADYKLSQTGSVIQAVITKVKSWIDSKIPNDDLVISEQVENNTTLLNNLNAELGYAPLLNYTFAITSGKSIELDTIPAMISKGETYIIHVTTSSATGVGVFVAGTYNSIFSGTLAVNSDLVYKALFDAFSIKLRVASERATSDGTVNISITKKTNTLKENVDTLNTSVATNTADISTINNTLEGNLATYTKTVTLNVKSASNTYVNIPFKITSGNLYNIKLLSDVDISSVRLFDDGYHKIFDNIALTANIATEALNQIAVIGSSVLQVYIPSSEASADGTLQIQIADVSSSIEYRLSEDLANKVDIKCGINLLNTDKSLVGYAFDSSGQLYANTNYNITEFILWGDNTQIIANCIWNFSKTVQYDSDGNILDIHESKDSGGKPCVVSKVDGAVSFRVMYLASYTNPMIRFGNVMGDYEEFNPIGGYQVNGSTILPTISASKYEENLAIYENQQRTIITSSTDFGTTTIINVKTDAELASLKDSVISKYTSGSRNIIVLIDSGTYHYSNAIEFSNLDYSDLSLRIVGKGDVVMIGAPTTNKFSQTDANVSFEGNRWKVPCTLNAITYSKAAGYMFYELNDGKEHIGYSVLADDQETGYSYSKELIEVVDEAEAAKNITTGEDTLCRLKINIDRDYSEDECDGAFFHNFWRWNGIYSKVKEIKDGYVYFYYPSIAGDAGATWTDVEYEGKTYSKPSTWSPNTDIHYNKLGFIRYRLVNFGDGVTILNGYFSAPFGYESVYVCNACSFLKFSSAKFGYFSIDGIKFLGNAWATYCISVSATQFGLAEIKNCKAIGLYGGFISVSGTDASFSKNIIVSDCTISDCDYYAIVHFTNKTENCQIVNCKFKNSNPIRQWWYAAIYGHGKNTYIGYNEILDFNGKGIQLGEMVVGSTFGLSGTTEVSGIVEYNRIVQSEDFYKSMRIVGINDFGAIYTSPNSTQTIVRYNYINRVGSSANGGQGIYNDDGSAGYVEYGNIIMNIDGMAFYFRNAIQSSVDGQATQTTSDGIYRSNRNNFVMYNIVIGGFQFQGRLDASDASKIDASNYMGENFLLYATDTEPDNIVGLLDNIESNVFIKGDYSKDNSHLYVDKKLYTYLIATSLDRAFIQKYISC